MNRIKDYEVLKDNIVRWLKDYYWMHSGNIKGFVVGSFVLNSKTHLLVFPRPDCIGFLLGM